jgi:hypothetical protein
MYALLSIVGTVLLVMFGLVIGIGLFVLLVALAGGGK